MRKFFKSLGAMLTLAVAALAFAMPVLAEDSENPIGSQNDHGFLEASALSEGSVWIVIAGIVIICAAVVFIAAKKKRR